MKGKENLENMLKTINGGILRIQRMMKGDDEGERVLTLYPFFVRRDIASASREVSRQKAIDNNKLINNGKPVRRRRALKSFQLANRGHEQSRVVRLQTSCNSFTKFKYYINLIIG
jgi:hypothetical protein